MPMVLKSDVQQPHKGIMLRCPDTFGHVVKMLIQKVGPSESQIIRQVTGNRFAIILTTFSDVYV